ncbi:MULTISPECIES: adenylate/guanylate cyclase domain-containing protein [Xanthomonas]|uniref:adenylate/guanylate cyclase domain-containing protein n=1 Tax=Xanthomonas TaxID=338 RepID=UPI000C448E7D|nr:MULTISPECIES: adenylate/guanylate cyclase domain-containing protein [Xanthomonas]MBV6687074.1 adenylate/guanylate cyclase domain-containing protein [Xanthomonas euvesicatoria pv. physalidis]MBV6799063.1 adenylate/guanylate cyclase domain-containing protein [Xanthomonas campestris pv. obscurae]MBV6864078.1 adenylate/guanylate cyclase domain-containing protein [Xanthomonas campestris pv. blepharidis]QTF19444.1 adenylate/guanylate cyclase domain-containing protein [Xanthomonas citri pv. phaseol
MAIVDDLTNETDQILNQQWSLRDGSVVPKTETVLLAGGGVKLTPVMLYADLADSTLLASNFNRQVASKVIKAFLSAACRIIRYNGGDIRSFDGDRVMGVFLGERMHTKAALTALQINYAVIHVLRPKIEVKYPALAEGGYRLNHAVGIDKSEVLVTRSGIRDNNDLIWVGRSPNIAAKLAAIRQGHITSFMTKSVYDLLAEDGKFAHDGASMWDQGTWNNAPLDDVKTIYQSSWWKKPK